MTFGDDLDLLYHHGSFQAFHPLAQKKVAPIEKSHARAIPYAMELIKRRSQ